ncbi:MAG: c-type cytochrome [Gemmatimonadetes bacterium]|nr:c-type cytochrome [Gemmatimonadota bacterium]
MPRFPLPSAPVLLFSFLVLPLAVSSAGAQDSWTWPDRGQNLQVFPEDTSPERLRAVMTGFTRALGVRCSHCHVGDAGKPLSTYDFASDENPMKQTARVMLEMLGTINKSLDTIEPSGPTQVNMWCHTCHMGKPRPMTLAEELTESLTEGGAGAMVEKYEELHENFYGRGGYDFSEGTLNSLGYEQLEAGALKEAIALFRLNVERFPASGNVHDSLAEAYREAGDRERAILHYQQALFLDPDNDNAAKMLAELRQEGAKQGD